jgi:hypothetical protein
MKIDDPKIMAVKKLIVYKLFYNKWTSKNWKRFNLTWAFYDSQRREYYKRTEILLSWKKQNVTFIYVINTWTPLLEPRTARVKLPHLWMNFCFMIITQTISIIMESMDTWKVILHYIQPNVKKRSNGFNE